MLPDLRNEAPLPFAKLKPDRTPLESYTLVSSPVSVMVGAELLELEVKLGIFKAA